MIETNAECHSTLMTLDRITSFNELINAVIKTPARIKKSCTTWNCDVYRSNIHSMDSPPLKLLRQIRALAQAVKHGKSLPPAIIVAACNQG